MAPIGSLLAPFGHLLGPIWCHLVHFCSPHGSIFSFWYLPAQRHFLYFIILPTQILQTSRIFVQVVHSAVAGLRLCRAKDKKEPPDYRRTADRYKSNLVSQPYSVTLGRFIRHVSTICAQKFGWHSDHVRIETLLNESVIAVIRFSTTFNACARKPFLTGRFGSGR